ncbi:LOW QUALITY PROTEIN: hypothetical protein Q4I30_005880 [Leishmania utingensis]|uniref:Uncharacterized protein n=1 Tax=Leishmania utingensis TaxID=653362 RepID=A0AAW3A677_9TRYP
MNPYNRNIVIVSSTIYGGVLCGILYFLLNVCGKPFYNHPSVPVAIFSVFWFSFAPSILFIGAAIPWLCVVYSSKAVALIFTIASGCIFVPLGALWLFVYGICKLPSWFVETQHNAPWSGNGVSLGATVGGCAAHRYRYNASDTAGVDGAELASVANSTLPRPYDAWVASLVPPGFEGLNAVITPVSSWQSYKASGKRKIALDTRGHASDHAYYAGLFGGRPALPAHAGGQFQPSYPVQERRLGAHYLA